MSIAKTTVSNVTGLHARPAQMLVKLCAAFPCDIKIITERATINAKSIFSILGGAIKQGTPITIEAVGEREEEACQAVMQFIGSLAE